VFIARQPTISPAAFFPITALVLSETIARRRFVHPRRQHLQIDQIVEFDRRLRHASVLRQAG
jgi:hypothetical protein